MMQYKGDVKLQQATHCQHRKSEAHLIVGMNDKRLNDAQGQLPQVALNDVPINLMTHRLSRYKFSPNDDDFIHFLDEDHHQMDLVKHQVPWKILVADDDVNVHDTTLLALNGVLIHGRPLEFLHAYSAAQARQVLTDNPDTALVLLDVVMETIDAGLRLVEVIRNEMGQHQLRIVLRTGQPGYAPEKRLNNDFAIDGYTTKSKLTRSMLISVLNDTLDSNGYQEN